MNIAPSGQLCLAPLSLFLASRVGIHGMEGCSIGGAVLNLLQRQR